MYQQYCGGTFFAVPYLGLSVGILPALAIGIGAFGASELVFHSTKKEINFKSLSFDEEMQSAKLKNDEIFKMISKIEDNDMKNNIKEINNTINSILHALQDNPEKSKKMGNFFNYYLPVTLDILKKYDEIENQKLISKESAEYMSSTRNMIQKINQAFKNQLANLYETDIVGADAEMKVFKNMLKADGYNWDEELEIKKEEK